MLRYNKRELKFDRPLPKRAKARQRKEVEE